MQNEHSTTASDALCSAMDKWASIALARGWGQRWTPLAIFPCELVFFLANCETAKVTRILESGRLDGYSTEAIAAFTQLKGGLACSIDLEIDPERAQRCRERLSGTPNLTLLRGDSKTLLGRELARHTECTTAILMDGPKRFVALPILLAAARFPSVRLISLHNLNPRTRERAMFDRLVPGPKFYEDIEATLGQDWRTLRSLEREVCAVQQKNRPSDASSLRVIRLDGVDRALLSSKPSLFFGWNQPHRYLVRWGVSRVDSGRSIGSHFSALITNVGLR